MVNVAHQPVWAGPTEQTPWWWPYILQIERRIESLNETAAYDPDKLPPPKDLYPLDKSDELDIYLDERRQEGDRRAKEKQPLGDY